MAFLKTTLITLIVATVCYGYTALPQSQDYGSVSPGTCSTNDLNVLSCTAEANVTDSCCVENPGGLLLLTQLYNPKLGPPETWTMHGLWGDYCNGSFPSSCDPSRTYENISEILLTYGKGELLSYMETNFLNDPPVTTVNGTAQDLWSHEWSKHGTCMSTLRTQCYGPMYRPGQELIDFFAATVKLSKSLPTYQFLEYCGIVPSDDATYELEAVEKCLESFNEGNSVHLGCSEEGVLREVWYYFHWRGRISDGVTQGANSTFPSACPKTGIRYPPKVTVDQYYQ